MPILVGLLSKPQPLWVAHKSESVYQSFLSYVKCINHQYFPCRDFQNANHIMYIFPAYFLITCASVQADITSVQILEAYEVRNIQHYIQEKICCLVIFITGTIQCYKASIFKARTGACLWYDVGSGYKYQDNALFWMNTLSSYPFNPGITWE